MMSKKYDICIFYARFIDYANHLLTNLKRYYLIASRWVRKLKRWCESKSLICPIVILSDHGGKSGVHTPYAFWSSSFKLPREPEKITDWYYIIEKTLCLRV